MILVIVSLHFHCSKEKTRPITLAVLTCGTSEKSFDDVPSCLFSAHIHTQTEHPRRTAWSLPFGYKKKSNHAPSRRVVKQYKPVYYYFKTQPLRNNQKIKFGLSDSRVCSHSLSSMLDHNCSVSLIPSLVLALWIRHEGPSYNVVFTSNTQQILRNTLKLKKSGFTISNDCEMRQNAAVRLLDKWKCIESLQKFLDPGKSSCGGKTAYESFHAAGTNSRGY